MSWDYQCLAMLGVTISGRRFHLMDGDIERHADRRLKWEYGLRPDLLAVTNIWEQAGCDELMVAAKGAPETMAELCHLPERDRAQ